MGYMDPPEPDEDLERDLEEEEERNCIKADEQYKRSKEESF